MKPFRFLFAILIFIVSLPTSAQIKSYDFNILAHGNFGFGTVNNKLDPNYNVNINNTDLFLKYRITYRLGLATGIGINRISGNGFKAKDYFFHERITLKLPISIILDYTITDHFSVVPNIGIYAQNILKDRFQLESSTIKNVYSGWNMGAQLGIGLTYKINRTYQIGLNYALQQDFTFFQPNGNQNFNTSNKQLIGSINMIGLLMVITL
ncbi:hypothetical protein CW751_10555 [Brumimicrobium salinarum]|uniref:Outer membrane protein beta-barrel domain-containing protein n=1 Tax=Brumimicrobium salinarum TaxID=2058658 RepID=A0A2I0R160_9FLAO|nr:hypothetical protein [Brumimicrobium salinarum]PKR80285.1 hypothetical protein CW751_10555 [Brumimicrobium salinarum]